MQLCLFMPSVPSGVPFLVSKCTQQKKRRSNERKKRFTSSFFPVFTLKPLNATDGVIVIPGFVWKEAFVFDLSLMITPSHHFLVQLGRF